MLGMQNPDKGQISLLNKPASSIHETNGGVVGIFDTPSLHPNLTVRQSLEYAVLLCDKPTRKPSDVENLLGVEKFSNYKIKHLSLGNKRRASIAHALIGSPKLIVLDEPFNGLDAGGVDDVLALIKNLNSEENTSFILSSHQLPYLESICSHAAILHNGQISASGAIEQLISEEKLLVQLHIGNSTSAVQLIQSNPKLELQSIDEDGGIQLALTDMDSADLNSWLVNNNVPVKELVIRRSSLSKLFKKLTSEPNKRRDS